MTQLLPLILALGVGVAAALLLLGLSRRRAVPSMTVAPAEPPAPERAEWPIALLVLTALVGLILLWGCGATTIESSSLLWGLALLALAALALFAIRWPDWL